ncbi:MAG: hypothetical protein ABI876_00075 [Bacteroidota bacterium]
MTNYQDSILFEEEQQIRQPWIWMLMLPISIASLGTACLAAYRQLYRGIPFGDHPMTDVGLIIFIVVLLMITFGLPLLVYKTNLHVIVDRETLHVDYYPFTHKHIPLKDIVSWEAVTYRPIAEYGGWGLRYASGKGWAYTVRGDMGLRLELSNGKRKLIGSQRAEELKEAIDQGKGVADDLAGDTR